MVQRNHGDVVLGIAWQVLRPNKDAAGIRHRLLIEVYLLARPYRVHVHTHLLRKTKGAVIEPFIRLGEYEVAALQVIELNHILGGKNIVGATENVEVNLMDGDELPSRSGKPSPLAVLGHLRQAPHLSYRREETRKPDRAVARGT